METSEKREWLRAVIFTASVVALVTAAVSSEFSYLVFVMLAMVLVMVGVFFSLFPGSRFFVVMLANQIAVYTVAFGFLARANFQFVSEGVIALGFALPLVGFVLGSIVYRRDIRKIVDAAAKGHDAIRRKQSWMLPVALVMALTFVEPGDNILPWQQNLIFLIEMTAITAVMFLLSRDICAFVGHVGYVFSDFFGRIVKLSVPATAFLTMYSLNIILFACIYQLFDRLTVHALFSVGGDDRALSFSEAIYFSVITLSTVGYGDITPLADSVRVVASLQIVLGVLLGLFGFAEIMRYATEFRSSGQSD